MNKANRLVLRAAATNLSAVNWTPLATNTFTGARWLFIDTNTPVIPQRVFRVRLLR
jgi:hypothetical protein